MPGPPRTEVTVLGNARAFVPFEFTTAHMVCAVGGIPAEVAGIVARAMPQLTIPTDKIPAKSATRPNVETNGVRMNRPFWETQMDPATGTHGRRSALS